MTIFPRFWPRRGLLDGVPTTDRLFSVAPHSQLLGHCHFQLHPEEHPTLILIHGLEGCSDSHYMRGIARKAWRAGLNVIRLNQRNCGGTEHLTPTLYHSGLSEDVRAVVVELGPRERLDRIWVGGYSMGGNLALKMAGEARSALPALRGVVAVGPNIHPGDCVTALERLANWMYHDYFLKRLKARLRRKARLFPGKFEHARISGIRTLREFDEVYTAPDGGFQNADDYYDRAGARHVLGAIEVPTLIITAQDDPFIPYSMFDTAAITSSSSIRLWAPRHGGHCGFIQRPRAGEDVYWAENRLVEFVISQEGTCH